MKENKEKISVEIIEKLNVFLKTTYSKNVGNLVEQYVTYLKEEKGYTDVSDFTYATVASFIATHLAILKAENQNKAICRKKWKLKKQLRQMDKGIKWRNELIANLQKRLEEDNKCE